jgi:hypothetical protein
MLKREPPLGYSTPISMGIRSRRERDRVLCDYVTWNKMSVGVNVTLNPKEKAN